MRSSGAVGIVPPKSIVLQLPQNVFFPRAARVHVHISNASEICRDFERAFFERANHLDDESGPKLTGLPISRGDGIGPDQPKRCQRNDPALSASHGNRGGCSIVANKSCKRLL